MRTILGTVAAAALVFVAVGCKPKIDTKIETPGIEKGLKELGEGLEGGLDKLDPVALKKIFDELSRERSANESLQEALRVLKQEVSRAPTGALALDTDKLFIRTQKTKGHFTYSVFLDEKTPQSALVQDETVNKHEYQEFDSAFQWELTDQLQTAGRHTLYVQLNPVNKDLMRFLKVDLVRRNDAGAAEVLRSATMNSEKGDEAEKVIGLYVEKTK